MAPLNLIAAVLAVIIVLRLSRGAKDGLSSICSKGEQTLHSFNYKLLLGKENISFADNKNQIVLIANVASF